MGIKLGLGDGRGVKGLIDFELGLLQSYKVTENSGANAYQRFVKERLLIPEHLLERASALPAGWQGPSWRLAKVATSWIRMRSGADAEGQKAHADPAEDEGQPPQVDTTEDESLEPGADFWSKAG